LLHPAPHAPPDTAPARGPHHGRDRGVGSHHPTLLVSRRQARQRSRTQDRAAWDRRFADLERAWANRGEANMIQPFAARTRRRPLDHAARRDLWKSCAVSERSGVGPVLHPPGVVWLCAAPRLRVSACARDLVLRH